MTSRSRPLDHPPGGNDFASMPAARQSWRSAMILSARIPGRRDLLLKMRPFLSFQRDHQVSKGNELPSRS